MKSKFNQAQDNEIDDDADIETGGPSIAAAKKSKVAVIAASSILITMVIYFMFFKGDNAPDEKLVEVAPPKVSKVAPSQEGKSPFEFEDLEQVKEDNELSSIEAPAVPEVPELPSLPEGTALPDQNILAPQQPQLPANPEQPPPAQLPTLPAPIPDGNNNQVLPPSNQASNSKKNYLDNPRYAPIIVFSGVAEGNPSRGVGYDNNIVQLNKDPIDDLALTESSVVPTYIKDRRHTIAQGKLITAVLETAINTEIPGFVRGIVSRDVYGEAGSDVLIPRGSRLFGAYTSEVNKGQGRVEIGWTRLIRPDGVDLAVSFNASDQFGRSGIPGAVDNKYGSIIANSMLTSVLAVGSVAAAQALLDDDDLTTTNNVNQGTVTTTGNATNRAIYDVSRQVIDTVGKIVSSTINVNPVIRVPQGTRITVIVNSDIEIPAMK